MELEEIRDAIFRVASETASYLRDLACSDDKLEENMGGETVLVDVLAENYIIGALKEEIGDNIRIVTEEKGVIGDGNLTFIVDPLDGSKNYLNCIPWASVSIAVAPSTGSLKDVFAGVVAPIFYGAPISFARGEGCFMGRQRIRPLDPPEKFIYVYIDHPDAAERIANVIGLLGGGFKVRSLGSAALEISYVGIGRGTAFLDFRSKLRNVDVAAALGIVRECGGIVVNDKGASIDAGVGRVERVGNIMAFSRKNIIRELNF